MLDKNGDFTQIGDLKKAKIRCYVKETYPKFLISDGTFFISGYFTKDWLKNSASNKIKITDLGEGLILINKWSIELCRVNSAEDFTSYSGIEMRLIIHDF